MSLSSTRFACCRKHSKIRSTGCRMVPHERSPLCRWNQCGSCAACLMVSLSKQVQHQRIERNRGRFRRVRVLDPSEGFLHDVGIHFH